MLFGLESLQKLLRVFWSCKIWCRECIQKYEDLVQLRLGYGTFQQQRRDCSIRKIWCRPILVSACILNVSILVCLNPVSM